MWVQIWPLESVKIQQKREIAMVAAGFALIPEDFSWWTDSVWCGTQTIRKSGNTPSAPCWYLYLVNFYMIDYYLYMPLVKRKKSSEQAPSMKRHCIICGRLILFHKPFTQKQEVSFDPDGNALVSSKTGIMHAVCRICWKRHGVVL